MSHSTLYNTNIDLITDLLLDKYFIMSYNRLC